jgi:hypothetical protein
MESIKISNTFPSHPSKIDTGIGANPILTKLITVSFNHLTKFISSTEIPLTIHRITSAYVLFNNKALSIASFFSNGLRNFHKVPVFLIKIGCPSIMLSISSLYSVNVLESQNLVKSLYEKSLSIASNLLRSFFVPDQ